MTTEVQVLRTLAADPGPGAGRGPLADLLPDAS
jgi:hypothetical protein